MELIMLSVAVGAGLDLRRALVLALVVSVPLLVLILTLALAVRGRRRDDDGAAVFCEVVAAELRSGASLLSAVSAAQATVEGSGPAEAVIPPTIEQAARGAAESFPEVGPELKATILSASRGGAAVADLFDEIGSLAIATAELGREVRIATAPSRATAAVFLAAPTLFLAWQLHQGVAGRLLAHPDQRVAVVAGITLFAVGVLTAVLISVRSR